MRKLLVDNAEAGVHVLALVTAHEANEYQQQDTDNAHQQAKDLQTQTRVKRPIIRQKMARPELWGLNADVGFNLHRSNVNAIQSSAKSDR